MRRFSIRTLMAVIVVSRRKRGETIDGSFSPPLVVEKSSARTVGAILEGTDLRKVDPDADSPRRPGVSTTRRQYPQAIQLLHYADELRVADGVLRARLAPTRRTERTSGPRTTGSRTSAARIRKARLARTGRTERTPAAGQLVAFGFSQGAQMALEVAFANPAEYRGAIEMSPGTTKAGDLALS